MATTKEKVATAATNAQVKSRIEERIAEIQHALEHAEEEKTQTLQKMRIQAEAQIAGMDGRLSQRIEDLRAEVATLEVLLGGSDDEAEIEAKPE